jgi:hypothetical protein
MFDRKHGHALMRERGSLLQVARIDWDADAYGNAMMAWWAVCDELNFRGAPIPDEWRYRPGGFGITDIRDITCPLGQAAASEHVNALLYAGEVLRRAVKKIRDRGDDY